jgi:preprotein translocase subunit SecD
MAAKKRRVLAPLLSIVLVAALALTYTFASGNAPFLGLDLQGGISVVLKPTEEVSDDAINQAIAIMRQRVDALGVAEPEITRQGDNILVQIPGVENPDRALELVGQTAELRFRPVLSVAGTQPQLDTQEVPIEIPPTGEIPTDSTVPGAVPPASDVPTSEVTPPTEAPAVTEAPPVSEQGFRASGPGEYAAGAQTPDTVTETTLAPEPLGPPSAPTPAPTDSTLPGDPSLPTDPTQVAPQTQLPEEVCVVGVPPELDPPDQPVTLPQCEEDQIVALYQLGPTMLTGESLEGANAVLGPDGQWVVNPTFRAGPSGIDAFNQAAAACNGRQPSCPTGQLAIVLDGRVISAPAINEASFQRDQIQISGSFTEREAKDLATALKYGALPVELEQQQAQIVSATLGRDALDAGLWAGLVGILLVTIYMLAFYRILGALAIAKLVVEAALIWSIVSYLGANAGLALTLAGVTGLIVSIGVSVDSNVVYYEHLKEDVRHGRTVRSATDKAFPVAYRTILAANVASLIGAAILYWLTVGPVRGFAFYLGLATLLDLIAAYFFMRPAVSAATRSDLVNRHPRWFGLPEGPTPSSTPPAVTTEERQAEEVVT